MKRRADPVLAKKGADQAPPDYNWGLEKEPPAECRCWWGVRDDFLSIFIQKSQQLWV